MWQSRLRKEEFVWPMDSEVLANQSGEGRQLTMASEVLAK